MSKRDMHLLAGFALLSAAFFTLLLSGFVPHRDGIEIRRKASHELLATKLPPAHNHGQAIRQAAVSGFEPGRWTQETPAAASGLLSLYAAEPNLRLPVRNAEGRLPEPSLPQIVPSPAPWERVKSGPEPELLRDEELDSQGRPLRWLSTSALLFAYSPLTRPMSRLPEPAHSKPVIAPRRQFKTGIQHYASLIEEFSARYNLDSALVYAIVHSESNFSPGLVSHKSAMGLMQLLPSTANGEVHRFLYGRRGSVSYEQLRIPEINIRFGTAYLHILFTRYFSGVNNPLSREYCTVAAYNMGPNGFLRTYGKNPGEAIARINEMSPEELFASFARRLPQRETRQYVIKVRNAKQMFLARR